RELRAGGACPQMFGFLKRRRRILESDFGRKFGWYVEQDGCRVAVLTDSQWDSDSQFWHQYKVIPLTTDPKVIEALKSPEFWWGNLVFENRECGTRVQGALAGQVRVAE